MKSLIILLAIFLSATHAFAQEPVWSKKYHSGSVTCLDFSGDGGKLLSGGMDQSVIMWNVQQQDSLKKFTFPGYVFTVDFGRKNWFLICTGELYNNQISAPANYIHFYDRPDSAGVFYSVLRAAAHKDASLHGINFNGGFISADDKEIITLASGKMWYQASIYATGSIAIYPVDTLSKNNIYTHDFFSDLQSFSVASNKRYLHGAGSNSTYFYRYGTVSYFYSGIFDCFTKKGHGYFSDIKSNNFTITSAFTHDNARFLTGNKNGAVYVRSIPEGTIVDSLGSSTSITTALAANMQGQYYFSAHEDTTLRIWTPGVHNIFKKVKLQSAVTTIAVSPDSLHFATAHTDGTVALWNIDSLALKAVIDSVLTPTITFISPSQILCLEKDGELEITAKSNFGETLLYQWQRGGNNLIESDSIQGVHTQKLVIKNVEWSDAGNYSVEVKTEKGGKSILNLANVTVQGTPVIVKQPYEDINGTGKFTLKIEVADPKTVQFQWYKNEKLLPTLTDNYIFLSSTAIDSGIYFVVITNSCDSVKSSDFAYGVKITNVAENPFKNTTLSAEPNPFKNSTTIRFSLPTSLKIKLAVTDILGREVAVLKDGFMETGEQNVVFKNEDLPNGTYFITLSGDGLLKTIPVNIAR